MNWDTHIDGEQLDESGTTVRVEKDPLDSVAFRIDAEGSGSKFSAELTGVGFDGEDLARPVFTTENDVGNDIQRTHGHGRIETHAGPTVVRYDDAVHGFTTVEVTLTGDTSTPVTVDVATLPSGVATNASLEDTPA